MGSGSHRRDDPRCVSCRYRTAVDQGPLALGPWIPSLGSTTGCLVRPSSAQPDLPAPMCDGRRATILEPSHMSRRVPSQGLVAYGSRSPARSTTIMRGPEVQGPRRSPQLHTHTNSRAEYPPGGYGNLDVSSSTIDVPPQQSTHPQRGPSSILVGPLVDYARRFLRCAQHDPHSSYP